VRHRSVLGGFHTEGAELPLLLLIDQRGAAPLIPVMRSSVYGWRCPRIRSQPSSCVRKCQSLRRLPCETTSARTLAPETSGAPSFTSAPSPTSNTSSSTLAPTSWASFSTLRRSPSLTRYCFPPVLTTAYIGDLLAFRLGPGPAGRGVPPPGAERNGRCSGSRCQSQAIALRTGFPTRPPGRERFART